MNLSSPCQYLQVSHQWRHRIIQSVNGLSFSISEDDSGGLCSQVIQVAQYTKSLQIDHYSEGTWLGDLLHDYATFAH